MGNRVVFGMPPLGKSALPLVTVELSTSGWRLPPRYQPEYAMPVTPWNIPAPPVEVPGYPTEQPGDVRIVGHRDPAFGGIRPAAARQDQAVIDISRAGHNGAVGGHLRRLGGVPEPLHKRTHIVPLGPPWRAERISP